MSGTEEYQVKRRVVEGKNERDETRHYIRASEMSFHDQLDAAEKVGLYPLIEDREQGFSFQLRTLSESRELVTRAMRGKFRSCVRWR